MVHYSGNKGVVGAALIGCKVGDSVDVTLPNGNIITYKLLEVSRSK